MAAISSLRPRWRSGALPHVLKTCEQAADLGRVHRASGRPPDAAPRRAGRLPDHARTAEPEIIPSVDEYMTLHTRHEAEVAARLAASGHEPDADGSFFRSFSARSSGPVPASIRSAPTSCPRSSTSDPSSIRTAKAGAGRARG